MKRSLGLLAGMFLCLYSAHGQANVEISTAARSKPVEKCRPQSRINSDGVLEFTDCSGKTERENRDKFDPPTSSSNPASGLSLEPATRQKQQEALRAKYEYEAFSYAHARRTFEFQYWSGKIIFWAVLLIVFSGLAFSAVQFYMGLRHPLEKRRKKTNVDDSASEDPCVSEFEASLQGIKLKSSVLGLLILAMSMVFFYLYLKFVYQITNISQ